MNLGEFTTTHNNQNNDTTHPAAQQPSSNSNIRNLQFDRANSTRRFKRTRNSRRVCVNESNNNPSSNGENGNDNRNNKTCESPTNNVKIAPSSTIAARHARRRHDDGWQRARGELGLWWRVSRRRRGWTFGHPNGHECITDGLDARLLPEHDSNFGNIRIYTGVSVFSAMVPL